jgi:hypothetical protein
MNKVCLQCSKNYNAINSKRKYCSHFCRLIALHINIRKYPEKKCLTCGINIPRKHIKTAKTCSMKCFSSYAKLNFPKGEKHHRFKGEEYSAGGGYLRTYKFYSSRKRYNSIHRIVMEEHLGRPLSNKEVVHHINGDKSDNRLENLEVLSISAHTRLHCEELLKKRWNKPSLKLRSPKG